MNARKFATVSAAEIVVAAISVPVVNAQAELGGSSGGANGSSLDTQSLEGGSAEGVVPSQDPAATCVLPGLGGSVGKIWPLLGITGVPSIAVTLATSALDSFPNGLEMIAGEGAGGELLKSAGSLESPLCTTVLGGRMTTSTTPTTPATPTVIIRVDADGNTTTETVTPTQEETTESTPSSSPTSVPAAGGSADMGNLSSEGLSGFGS